MPEVEVFRLTPQIGKKYHTALWTRRIGYYPNDRYYTTNPLVYVGWYRRTERFGPDTIIDFFDIDGKEVRVEYTYEGTTSFVEAV